jgi:hypothetical protein
LPLLGNPCLFTGSVPYGPNAADDTVGTDDIVLSDATLWMVGDDLPLWVIVVIFFLKGSVQVEDFEGVE